MEEKSSRAPLRLIYAGGTIGAAGRPLAPLPGERFEALCRHHLPPLLPAMAEAGWHHLDPAIDSTDATPADWARLMRAVLRAAIEGAPGAVVLHGTDTLAEAAAALACLATATEGARPVARLAMPVTVLGAMQPLFADADGGGGGRIAPGGDAVASLAAALARPGDDAAGVMLACDGRLLPAARAAKIDAAGRPAFACPAGASAGAGAAGPLPPADPAVLLERLEALAPHLGRRSVVTLLARPEAPGRLAAELDALLAAPAVAAGAVLLLGLGSGNLPGRDSLGAAVETARARGLPVVVATRVRAGGTALAGYAAGAWLRDLGIVEARDMTPEAAQAKLHIALARAAAEGWDDATTMAFLGTPIAGEITPG